LQLPPSNKKFTLASASFVSKELSIKIFLSAIIARVPPIKEYSLTVSNVFVATSRLERLEESAGSM
jgi:hypothetical protein